MLYAKINNYLFFVPSHYSSEINGREGSYLLLHSVVQHSEYAGCLRNKLDKCSQT